MQVDDAHDIEVVMPMNNLREYSDNDIPAVDANGAIVDLMELMLLLDRLILKQKQQVKQATMAQKMLK